MKILVVLFAALLMGSAAAQSVPVVMLSDLHFDPLRDPGKAERLAAAPVKEWRAILEAPPTTGHAIEFAAEQARCGARGEDSDYALMRASLQQAHGRGAHVGFVTVTGDLLVHAFECRYKESMHTDKGYAAFAEKTTNFVVKSVADEFSGVPVYFALGNNDSSCGDYSMDLHGSYFKATSDAVLGASRLTGTRLSGARVDYEEGGYFEATPPGMQGTQLLMIDDIFLSRRYSTCGGKKNDPAGREAVMQWLAAKLQAAEAHGLSVWVLGHIPPGIDVYSTVTKLRDVCGGKEPDMFLESSALGDLLAKYAGTVRLGLFGHTHADEMRLIGTVPAKLVGSVTPINGNLPTITIASVDRRSARLLDYTVYMAPDKTGAGTWTREYDFHQTYGSEQFSADGLKRLFDGFSADTGAATDRSKAYIHDFFPGGFSPLGLVWSQDVCALKGYSAESYRACTCKAKP